MPRGSPFTALCQLAAALARPVVADLHAHTVNSDGEYTPSQIVALARQARLAAIAVTDHDCVDGLPEAVAAAAGSSLVVVPGVECSARFDGRELHVLGYFVDAADPDFRAHLADVQRRRRARFLTAIDQLEALGASFPAGLVDSLAARTPSLGRRHLANLLVQSGTAENRGEAFGRFLRALDPPLSHGHLTDAGEVITRIHAAGGIASLAHPPREFGDAEFTRLKALGLDALEAHCPSTAGERTKELTSSAARLDLLVTGGTDTHGPAPIGHPSPRRVGSFGLPHAEWVRLAQKARAGG